MESAAYVTLALRTLSCTQKQLAAKMGVSQTQITKWKNGEYMSYDMMTKFADLTGIGEEDPAFVLAAGSIENATKWGGLIARLAESARDGAETGYDTYPLQDDLGLLNGSVFRVLLDMGVTIPDAFPADIDFDAAGDDEEEWEKLHDNPHASLIYAIFNSLNDVWGFYAAYVDDLLQEEVFLNTEADNIGPCLIELAAAKIEVSSELAPKFGAFRHKTLRDYEGWLNFVKRTCFQEGIPLPVELLDLVNLSADSLGHKAEAEAFGFNGDRLHPDIYMNELLVGMRVIHQVLPAILKKLGMEDEFTLDASELRNTHDDMS